MYYIYCHVNPRDSSLFYVGKGKKGRAYSISSRNTHHRNKLLKLKREGFSIKKDIVHFIELNIESEDEAYNKEVRYIAHFKKHYKLLNIAPGGEGGVGNSGRFGVENFNWVEIDKLAVISYLSQGFKIKEIAKKIKCGVGLIKTKCYPDTSLLTFCKTNNIIYCNHMAKSITEEDFKLQLKSGTRVKDIAKHFNVNLNYFKFKYYPDISIEEYCTVHNIRYSNPRQGEKNGNYKEINYEIFENLVKQNFKLKDIASKMGISIRCLIIKYKEKYNVGCWSELKRKLT